jgi:hypothetical protein
LRVRVAHLGMVDLTQIGKMAFRAMYFTEVILCLMLRLFGAYKAVMQTDVTALSENCCVDGRDSGWERDQRLCCQQFIYLFPLRQNLFVPTVRRKSLLMPPQLFAMVGRRIKNSRNLLIPSKTK